ncbi:putative ferric reductase transmembrane component [Candida viswanathii]|uniref:ferric-chelate reductase (NADPH) n=1 Tax=Candida viswanathii TaxID=5486 RepID=A0A367XSU6_9ASCO|nr:putative ferric reductase transmembrane component [Candida viswanathii]
MPKGYGDFFFLDLGYVACSEELTEFSADGSIQPFCDLNNQPAMGSMAYCLLDTFGAESRSYYQPYLNACRLSEKQFRASYQNATRYIYSPLSGSSSNYPAVVDRDQVLSNLDLLYNAVLTDNYSIWYGTALLAYWGLVMLVGTLNYWSHFLLPSFVKTLHGPVSNWVRRYLVLAPAFGHSHASSSKRYFKVIQAFIPLRFETLVILGWFILFAVFCGVSIYPTPEFGPGPQVGNRSGLLVGFAFPLLILFGGRNNFLQWLTGWPFARFLVFHRWIARIIFAALLVHVGSKTVGLKMFGVFPSYLSLTYMAMGVLGMVACGLLVGHSWQIFRNTNYEVFLIIHHILVILFIAGAWVHTRGTDTPDAYYAATAVWAFDKLIRVIRCSAYGVKKANVELIANEVLKVTIPRPQWWKPFPGSYAYIYFLKSTYFWQSHPFTMVDSVHDANTLTFYIKVKGGLTHGIYKQLLEIPGQSATFNVLVEGPYASPHSGRKFDNLILLSSGTGIPGLYYAALDLIRRHDCATKKIRLYWTIRDIKSIRWFMDEFLALKGSIVEPIIYITGALPSDNHPIWEKSDASISDSVMSFKEVKECLDFVEFRNGRPNAYDIVSQEVNEAQGSVAFITCGTPHLVDDARAAIVNTLKLCTSKRIELFEDFQEW